MARTTRVFVYGSLLAGEANHHHLAGAAFVGDAKTEATFELRDLGEYPGLVRGGAQAVVGEMYAVDAPTLAVLDAFEGHPTLYRRAPITLADGSVIESYLLEREQVEGRPVIASASWRARRPRDPR